MTHQEQYMLAWFSLHKFDEASAEFEQAWYEIQVLEGSYQFTPTVLKLMRSVAREWCTIAQ